jgi:hypothetical protein
MAIGCVSFIAKKNDVVARCQTSKNPEACLGCLCTKVIRENSAEQNKVAIFRGVSSGLRIPKISQVDVPD